MMSDEEKKAIEGLFHLAHINTYLDLEKNDVVKISRPLIDKWRDKTEILLNLIEKQSKEIEELKENNKNLEDELNKYIVKMSDEEKEAIEILKLYFGDSPTLYITKYVNIVLNLIEKKSKEIELLKEENEKYKNPPFFDEDEYTENDKIKAKIEEVKDGTYDAKIVLQSLLEKE